MRKIKIEHEKRLIEAESMMMAKEACELGGTGWAYPGLDLNS